MNNGYKTEIFKNLISEDQLETLRTLVNQSMASSNILEVSHGKYYSVSMEVANFLNKILPLLPNEEARPSLLKHSSPTGPHTDTNVADEDLANTDLSTFARTFIIPLVTQDTHTITFNQKMPNGSLGKNIGNFINDLPDINELSLETFNEYFGSPNDLYWLNKLSIETIFPWVAGDVLVFDRARIHSGDNHLGKVEKQGLVVWTTVS